METLKSRVRDLPDDTERKLSLDRIGDHQFENLAEALHWPNTEKELLLGLKELARRHGIRTDDDP
jgi:hypothetical protein